MKDKRYGPAPRGEVAEQHPLARWRIVRGWTQEQLAEQSEIGRVSIARIERGADPHVSTALRLAHALGVTVEDIWGDPPSAALRRAERQPRQRASSRARKPT